MDGSLINQMGDTFLSVVGGLLLASQVAWGQNSLISEGWTVTADPERGVIQIQHENLKTVLDNVQLNLHGDRGLRTLSKWSVQRLSQNQLALRTLEPVSRWVIDLEPESLKISSTLADAVLTAEAPASSHRIVARLLDPEGTPVTWRGTEEVNLGFGGRVTENPSFLPRRNPDVMYFSLGQVSSANLHSLFDRPSDVAIDFPERSRMQRNPQNPDLLDLTIPVQGNALIRLLSEYYTKTLGLPNYSPFDDSQFPKAPSVWCSWDRYAEHVREQDIVTNVDWISSHLKPYGFDYVVLDDGYDRGEHGEHYWISNWSDDRFPHGPKWLAGYIKSKGLLPGIWLVPNSYAGALDEHPGWYVHDRAGHLILDYSTPALDPTNPEVLEFLKHEFQTLDDWGFEYYKFDGEHALPKYVPSVDTDRLYNKLDDPLVTYRNRLKAIRQTIGPARFIEGCPAGTPLNGIGYFDSYFNGHDMYSNWQGNYPLFSSINANAFLNHLVVYTMAGEGVELTSHMTLAEAAEKLPPNFVKAAGDAIRARENPVTGIGTTLAEARTLVSYLSLTGVVYTLSSVMPELPAERSKLVKMTLPTVPILPVDLFSRGAEMRWDLFRHITADDYIHNYPEVLDLKVNAQSGVYDVVALTNWRGSRSVRELAFAQKLGLDPDAKYIVFDFWGQSLVGVFNGQMMTVIEPHDTRVFLIHSDLGRPQLVGTSRHITGAVSIRALAWDQSENRLSGTSDTVSGDDYSLWFYVPSTFTVSQVRASSAGQGRLTPQYALSGNSLRVFFPQAPGQVNWQVKFGSASGKQARWNPPSRTSNVDSGSRDVGYLR
ncbi:MAG TPA: alpha-galactosidase [Terriglobia bacterium]|nr:alpha-galactosidase [Terriglobia bacterium]